MSILEKRYGLKRLGMPQHGRFTGVARIIAVALLLAGCSSQRPLMPTPDIYAQGIKQPFAATLPDPDRAIRA